MTFAPPTIVALGKYWRDQKGVLLGIVGDTAHAQKGFSYHLGKSQLTATAYSARTKRDKAGLSEAASAIDLGRLDGSYANLRTFSKWLVEQCQANAEGTRDIREVIYTPDGVRVLRYDREQGVDSEPDPGEADNSHLTHTHVSFYRDSRERDKVGIFRPYFEPEEPMLKVTITGDPGSIDIIPDPRNKYYDLATSTFQPSTGTYSFTSKDPATPVVTPPVNGITEWYLVGADLALIPKANAIWKPAEVPVPNCDKAVADAIAATKASAYVGYK